MPFRDWDVDENGDPLPRVKWSDRHDIMRREENFAKGTRGSRARLGVHNAIKQPGWSAADRRVQRQHKLQQAAAVQGGMSKKDARKKYPTDKEAIQDANAQNSVLGLNCLVTMIAMISIFSGAITALFLAIL